MRLRQVLVEPTVPIVHVGIVREGSSFLIVTHEHGGGVPSLLLASPARRNAASGRSRRSPGACGHRRHAGYDSHGPLHALLP
jgi:hypothetical protein